MNQLIFIFLIAMFTTMGCVARDSVWDTSPSNPTFLGLSNAVAVIDESAQRVLFVTANADQTIHRNYFSVGRKIVQAEVSPDSRRLFILSAGDQPRHSEHDELPAFKVFFVDDQGSVQTKNYWLQTPLSRFKVDPLGQYVALFTEPSTSASNSFVENPNQIAIIDLNTLPSESNPVVRTIQSFGGRPQRITFTPQLLLPNGVRRLLAIETEQDLTLLDLNHLQDVPARPEITVRLTSGTDTKVPIPAALIFSDGDTTRNDDARIAVRFTNDSNLLVLTLTPSHSPNALNDFSTTINLVDAGGVVSDFGFVNTDGGMRIAALVPSKFNAVLIDPETSITNTILLTQPYQHLSVVSNDAGQSNQEVALLWGTSNSIAFWSLSKTIGQPYRSLEILPFKEPIAQVRELNNPNSHLRILEPNSRNGFYVLNLTNRTSAPVNTNAISPLLSFAPSASRIWVYKNSSTQFSSIAMSTLEPLTLSVDRPIDQMFDIDRVDQGRSLIMVHKTGNIGLTILDAIKPDIATARSYSSLLLEGL